MSRLSPMDITYYLIMTLYLIEPTAVYTCVCHTDP